jgi:hypothetical protein
MIEFLSRSRFVLFVELSKNTLALARLSDVTILEEDKKDRIMGRRVPIYIVESNVFNNILGTF